MAIIRFLLIVLLVYYLVKWLIKLILPHVIKQQMDKFQSQFNQQNSGHQQEEGPREGSVTVENVQPKPDKKKDDGDYVDFEEIK